MSVLLSNLLTAAQPVVNTLLGTVSGVLGTVTSLVGGLLK